MKRTEMKRGTKPMARSWLRRVTPKRREKTPDGWRSYWGPCPLCLSIGIIDRHHVIRRQTLKKRGLRAYLWDERNRMDACMAGCHAGHTSRVRPLLLSQVPTSAVEFAAELGLGDVLEREYGPRNG